MKRIALLGILLTTVFTASAAVAATKASSVTRHNITWTFDKDYEIGQFVNGDPWVIGPVKIVSITNDLSDEKYKPEDADVSGSMVNPVVDNSSFQVSQRQGFDDRIKYYDPELNAALPNGKPISKDNPLVLKPSSSLLSTVSWLWRSPEDKEPDAPKAPDNPPAQHMRPTLRAASVLTVLDKAPPEGSFRPAYAGNDKTIRFNVSDIRFDRLRNFAPVGPIDAAPIDDRVTPQLPNPPLPGDPYYKLGPQSVHGLVKVTERVFLDHVPGWYGGEAYHPTLNMPNYGREINNIWQTAMLALNLDWDKLGRAKEKPSKKALAVNMIQIGIDLTGMADNGTFWPDDGGHDHGRKPVILFTGLLLDDPHMKNVGNWNVQFQDNNQTFYVAEQHIEITNHEHWRETKTDKRSGNIMPYKKEHLGMPEWGIAQVRIPHSINAGWNSMYRDINAASIPGHALVFMMMEDGRKLFNHEAYFDYADRLKSSGEALFAPWHAGNRPPPFPREMWEAYRDQFPTTYDKKWDAPEITDYITQPKEQ